MRSILFTMVLLLLLPIAFGVNVQADETNPPPDLGVGDSEGNDDEDVEGDHPWGGENIVIDDTDGADSRNELRSTFTFEKYFRLFVYTYYGLDFLDRSTTEYTRSKSVVRFETPEEFSYRSDSKNRRR